MQPLIPDTNVDSRMAGLERFLEHYLGRRRPEFGIDETESHAIKIPDPLSRFFRFAGRWPGHNPRSPYENRFCMQDTLGGFSKREYAPTLQLMDDRLIFVWENQGVWVAATEPSGLDPPVWISENCSHRNSARVWRQLENPLSHFLVSFVLQELLFGSEIVDVAPDALSKFSAANVTVEPVWINGEYACDVDRPSYYFADDRFLIRCAPDEADGDDWFACNTTLGLELLRSLGL